MFIVRDIYWFSDGTTCIGHIHVFVVINCFFGVGVGVGVCVGVGVSVGVCVGVGVGFTYEQQYFTAEAWGSWSPLYFDIYVIVGVGKYQYV